MRRFSGYSELPAEALTVNQQLRLAPLKTDLALHDYSDASNNFSLQLDLSWTGDSAFGRGTSQFQHRTKNFIYHSVGTWRTAAVAGSISDGSENLIEGLSSSSQNASTNSGTISVCQA